MISVSKSRALEAKRHTRFSRYFPATLEDLANTITSEIWSPIVWKDGKRTKASFEKALVVALDFDKPTALPLKDALELCHDWGLSHVIGTTKSHQKEKVSASGKVEPPCDRYRLCFIADSWCEDRELYEHNMAALIEQYGCDRSCKDGARFFWPCQRIVSVGKGRKFQWLPLPEGHIREADKRAMQKQKYAHYPKGVLPHWVRDLLTVGVASGERHMTCYKLGANLTLLGYDEDEILDMVKKTPGLMGIGASDLERAVRNGINAAR